MIRIRLINEGKIVKQITSRVHEGVVLEQIKKYKDPYDTIQIVEGELSEGAKDMLHHVAKKIVPAAMAAGIALGGAHSAQAQGGANPHYPGLNHSIGQQMSDIFSPNYKEAMRQREHARNTERQVWDAEQNEIRRQRVADARSRAGGGQQHVIYDQSRLSQDGKSYIIYGIDNKVRRIPVSGTEYMAGDSQRLPHYITSGGNVLYVRHPHAVTESVAEGYTVTRGIDKERYQERPGLEGPFSTRSGKVVYYDPKEGKYYDPETDFYIGHEDYAKMDEAAPGLVKAAAGLALGGVAAAGAPAIVAILGPLLGIPMAAYGAYSAAKLGMQGVEKLWDAAAEKLGGDDKVAQYTSSKIATLPPEQQKAAAATVKQIGESKQAVAEGYYDLNDDGMQPIDLSANPSFKQIVNRYTQLVYQGHASETSPEEDQEYDAIKAYVAKRFGEKGSAHLQKAGEVSYWGRNDKPYGRDSRSSNLGRPNQPGGNFRTTKSGKMHGQDVKMMKSKVADRLGRHPEPSLPEGVVESDPNATVGTIPSTGTSGGTGRTQFAPTGKTTNAKFNKNGQIELDTEQEDDGSVNLDADAVKQLQQAGVQIKEDQDNPVAGAITRRILMQRSDLLSKYGPVLVMQAIDEVADYIGDVEEIGSSDVSGWVKHVEQMLVDNPPESFGEGLNEGSDTLEGILSKYSADYAKFRAGGDIDENQDFFDALYDHYLDSGEMPYTIAKGRDGDPYEWITQRLDQEAGVDPVAEAEGDEAGADQNIIMQIRKASDYEKPTRVELADGTESVIAPNIAKQILDKFDKMKPESKEMLQNTLNTEEGFKEILAYFGGGVREQAAARVGNIMQAAVAEAGFGRYDRRDAYQRDYDSSVAGMGKRQSLAYQLDGGANDEGWDKPEQERSYYKKAPVKKGYYFYNVPAEQVAKAEELGLFKTKSGKWYSPFENTRANMFFGAGRYWEPK